MPPYWNKMGFDIMVYYAVTYDRITGKPLRTAPPEIPDTYRPYMYQNGWFFANFVPMDATEMPASIFYDNLPEWDDIDWTGSFGLENGESREEYKEEYEEWRCAMEWFGENGFDVSWNY
jgi:hypothetical protein